MLTIQNNIELKNKTTIRLGGIAPYYLCITQANDLLEFQNIEAKLSIPFKILGGGSNLIIADTSIYPELPFGVLDIAINDEPKIQKVKNPNFPLPPLAEKALSNNQEIFSVTVGAGYKIPSLLKLCKEQGFTGLEGLIGVPGRIGGAVSMNAGAYKTEINDVLYSITLFHKQFGIITLNRENIHCEYRKCIPYYQDTKLTDFILISAEFLFPCINKEIVANKIKDNLFQKKNTQPISALTAGCVFKNPINENGEKISAGLLLEKAGLKQIHVNAMRFSPLHASFLENTGNGQTKDALELLALAKDKVATLFNIHLEEEVKLWI